MDHRTKLAWAQTHIDALTERTKAYLASKPYDLSHTVDERRGDQVLAIARVEPIPAEWSLVLGDIVHNLRSALDALVYALARAHLGRTPTDTEARQIQFPIVDRPDQWEGECKRWLRHIAPAAQLLIERCQPYHDANPREVHLLAALRDLSNIDKHRHLIVTLGIAETTRVEIRVPWAIGKVWTIEGRGVAVTDGLVLARWRIALPPAGLTPTQKVSVHMHVDCLIGTGNGDEAIGLTTFLGRTPAILNKIVFPQLEPHL
jgi:hypothetical protein